MHDNRSLVDFAAWTLSTVPLGYISCMARNLLACPSDLELRCFNGQPLAVLFNRLIDTATGPIAGLLSRWPDLRKMTKGNIVSARRLCSAGSQGVIRMTLLELDPTQSRRMSFVSSIQGQPRRALSASIISPLW